MQIHFYSVTIKNWQIILIFKYLLMRNNFNFRICCI